MSDSTPSSPDELLNSPSRKPGFGGPDENSAAPPALLETSTLEQSIGLYLSATVTLRFLNLVRVWLLAWFMTREQVGLFNVLLMAVSVFIPLCSLGLTDAVGRFVPMHEQRGTLAAFLRRAAGLVIGVTAVAACLAIFFSRALGAVLFGESPPSEGAIAPGSDTTLLAVLAAITVGLSVIYFLLLAALKGLRLFRALSILEVSHAGLFLVGAVGTIVAGRANAVTLGVVLIGSLVIPVIWCVGRVAWHLRNSSDQHRALDETGWARRLLRFSIWTMLAGLTWQGLQYYSAWQLNKTHGSEMAAIYTTVQRVTQLVLIGAVAVSMVVMTTVTKTWESQGREAAERQLSLAFRGTGLGLFFVSALVALMKNPIMWIFRPDYVSGAAIIPLQSAFFLLGGYLSFLPGHFHLREKTGYAFLAWMGGIAANILLARAFAGPAGAGMEAPGAGGGWMGTVLFPVYRDAGGLNAASWCALGAIGVAAALCALLLRLEGARLDRGSYVVLVAPVLLTLTPPLLAAGTLALFVAALCTPLVFEADERRRVFGYAFGALAHVPMIGRVVRRSP